MSINQLIVVALQGFQFEHAILGVPEENIDYTKGGDVMTGAEFVEQFVLGILTFHGFVMFIILTALWLVFVNFLGSLFFNRKRRPTVLHDYHEANMKDSIPDFICWDCDQANTGDMADVYPTS